MACMYLILSQDWPANVSIYADRPVYRSMLAGLSSASISDLGPTAAKDCRSAMSISTYVGKPVHLGQTVAYDCRAMYRSMLGGLSSARISDLGPTPAEACRFFCQYFRSRSNRSTRLQDNVPIAHARSGVLKSWSKIRFLPATTK